MSFCSCATPKKLHEGYSLQASENEGGAASAVAVVVMASARENQVVDFVRGFFMTCIYGLTVL